MSFLLLASIIIKSAIARSFVLIFTKSVDGNFRAFYTWLFTVFGWEAIPFRRSLRAMIKTDTIVDFLQVIIKIIIQNLQISNTSASQNNKQKEHQKNTWLFTVFGWEAICLPVLRRFRSEDDLLAANETAVPTHTKSKREDMIAQNCLIYLVKISIDEFCRDTSNQEQQVREVAVSSS